MTCLRTTIIALLWSLGAAFSCGAEAAAVPSLARHVLPTLYKLGCSAGECHGSFSGKGNFRLSLFAADPEADYRELHSGFDRRIDRQQPAKSLLLMKPTLGISHGGGLRLRRDSAEYQLLLAWVEAGGPADDAQSARVKSVRVEPPTALLNLGKPQSLQVWARYSDGSEANVTAYARLETLDSSIAELDSAGLVTALRAGDTHVLAHYAGQIGCCAALVPGPASDLASLDEPLADKLDQLLVDKLRRLNIVPSGLASDEDFLRRAHLDVIGRLPTPEEIRAFLADRAADKRAKVIDRLLEHPLHAAVWATKFCDAMGADNRTMYDESVYRIYDWMRNRFERNIPWDEVARGALTGTYVDGRSDEELIAENDRISELRKQQKELQKEGKTPPAPMPAALEDAPWRSKLALRRTLEDFSYNLKFRVQAGPRKGQMDPRPLSQHVATAFLGVRLECAECHKHPHDRWSQQDFFSFTTCFAYLARGLSPEMREKKLNFLTGTYVTAEPQETFPDPKTGEPLPPRPLDGPVITVTAGVDPRLDVWKWMVAPDNPYFAQAIVNRIWAHYFGRGLIEPVDALAEANPPSHPELLDELVRNLRDHKFDLRHLHRRILNTRSYQRDWSTNASNLNDERNFSHRVLRRMPAELVLDAIDDITGTPLKVDLAVYGGPKDDRTVQRAIEMPLSRPRGDDTFVLKIFDKPQRTQSCDCERSSAPNLSQAMYFYNDAALVAKIADPHGRLSQLLGEIDDDERLLEELYLLVLSRLPTAAERARSCEHVQAVSARAIAFEDLLWSLFNRQEFLVTH